MFVNTEINSYNLLLPNFILREAVRYHRLEQTQDQLSIQFESQNFLLYFLLTEKNALIDEITEKEM